jgi:hypothetical protein
MKNENRQKIAEWVNKRVPQAQNLNRFVATCAQVEGGLMQLKAGLEEAGIPWHEDEALDLYLFQMEENEAVVADINSGWRPPEKTAEIPEEKK